jgi:hypothetical protein
MSKIPDKQRDAEAQRTPGPPALVYKTRGDYLNLVPVQLSEDKTSIVSYPHPEDLTGSTGYLVPLLLQKGYLLDRKGIGKNVAFLIMSYTDYANLQNPPSLEELDKLILDRDPLLEMYDCGIITTFADPVKDLNSIIKHRKLKNYKRLK